LNDEQPLIIRAERDRHVRRSRATNANPAPARALPFEVELLFEIDLARVWRLAIQPKGQSVRRIRVRAIEGLREQVRRNNLFAVVFPAAHPHPAGSRTLPPS